MNTAWIMAASVAAALIGGAVFGEIPWLPCKEIGKLFVSLLKMVVVPIAFISITGAVIKLGGKVKGMTAKAFALMTGMSMAGVALGLLLMGLFGAPDVAAGAEAMEAEAPTFWAFVLGCIPVNPFKSLTEGKMLQVITLSFFIGAAACYSDKRQQIEDGFNTAQKICFKITGFVLKLAPLGVFALLYPVAAKSAGGLLAGYASMAAALVLGSLVYILCVELPLLKLYGVNVQFLKTVTATDIIGAVSGGASNYMAPRIALLKEKTDIPAGVIDYLIPLTAVLMRAGSCICVGIYTIFAASVYGVDLSLWNLLTVVVLSVIALTCAPGIIGGTLMDCAIVWAAAGIPLEAVALLAGIDYVMDVLRTILNIQGGEVVAACVGKKEGAA